MNWCPVTPHGPWESEGKRFAVFALHAVEASATAGYLLVDTHRLDRAANRYWSQRFATREEAQAHATTL